MIKSIASAALALPLVWSQPAAATPRPCHVSAPVLRVTGENWYDDPSGSIVNKAAVARHETLIRPLRTYVTELTEALDRGDYRCAERQLSRWAASKALLQQPSSFAGKRERLRFATAVSLAACRLRAARGSLEPSVKSWLRELGQASARDFTKRGLTDNLFVWSGVNSAIAWKLTGAPELKQSARQVLTRSTAQIGSDGLIPSELRRATRSLLYHSYYLSGLLTLTAVLPGSAQQNAAIRALTKRVTSGTCAPASFPAAQPQAASNQNDLVTIAMLAAAFDGRPPCGVRNMRLHDPLRGGSVQQSLDLLRQSRGR